MSGTTNIGDMIMDRYRMEITTSAKHVEELKTLGFETLAIEGKIANMVNYEFSGQPTLREAFNKPYIAYYHSNEYGDGIEVCDGHETVSNDVNYHGDFIVRVDSEGEVDETELIFVRDCIEMLNKVRAKFARK